MRYWLSIVVATPAHSSVAGPLTYRSEWPLPPGSLVRVPLGKREVLGVVWEVLPDSGDLPESQSKAVLGALDGLAPLSATWRRLVGFTASYYQRSIGEVALAALPPQLRELSTVQLARRLKRPVAPAPDTPDTTDLIALSAEQERAIAEFDADTRPALLFGATGSGKTEVYLRAAAKVLAGDASAQVLVMVPEINLTPQLQARFEERFAHLGKAQVVALHSGLTPAQRLNSWLVAHAGQARLVLGTRMAIFASLPNLRLIVVDEEHDPSYKQQEGARYSARDLAVYRAMLESARSQAGDSESAEAFPLPAGAAEPALPGRRRSAPPGGSAVHEATSVGACRVLLGSATPSLESWQATVVGRYQRLTMNERIGGAEQQGSLPAVRLVDMNHQPKHCTIAPPLLDAIAQRIARGEQSLIFLNRRGYAPVLACHDCGWKSECPHCSAFRVFHKIDRTLRCHHCGFTERVPRACPACGNIDIAPVGKGTERLEEHIAELLAGVTRPDGSPLRIARIDADTTRLKGALESQLASVHAREVDVLVGTQMIAKGHDFRHITLVAAINPDGALFSSDFRAPERLFGLLMQAAGRAGRDADHGEASEMWVQTFHPQHPLFAALKKHDYPAFAAQELKEREAAGMSPFGFSALVRAEARDQAVAQGFLNAAAAAAQTQQLPGHDAVTPYPAVPMTIQRVANIERAQMLVESPSRAALQRFLAAWQPLLHQTRQQGDFKSLVRWAIDVDPLAI
ncbi:MULTISPECIES: primosomal protein N' [unclassified Polaromonas]|jgi:primosomal protein N' (replication factor Y)|uniref:replication restart helicase PriA n=3 Tax=Polaromonas TaxID=52972 RepID=UPI000BC4485A|nr:MULTISPECIES: primosomal protein N' [unclassified Polaromonas]OYY34344.1 MAG: primosomal protein N' [Polaromonas sp. 35-63-35]OYZ17844.1 MAG: primosomal protein N' [Polaromonas sp. 16-63-31]OYZ77242.1 MAG: primosomal protein N' [Polaromonas sp. 24-63-21]OZA48174.1 MAG: primosomal protein N' [Polaromonas sp. 17-63-33]OZA86700.1 MAG: primosomal protein N' [Polaromonas sp. 39-63-25]